MIQFDIRHGQQVVLVRQREDADADYPKVGTVGRVIAMHVGNDQKAYYLVKWVRRSWPVSYERSYIKEID